MSRNETAGSGAGGGDRGQEAKKRIKGSGKNTQAWRQEKRQDQFRAVKQLLLTRKTGEGGRGSKSSERSLNPVKPDHFKELWGNREHLKDFEQHSDVIIVPF